MIVADAGVVAGSCSSLVVPKMTYELPTNAIESSVADGVPLTGAGAKIAGSNLSVVQARPSRVRHKAGTPPCGVLKIPTASNSPFATVADLTELRVGKTCPPGSAEVHE